MQVSLNQIHSISDLQRHYRKVISAAQKAPVIITSNNKPEVAILSIEYLDQLEETKRKLEKMKVKK